MDADIVLGVGGDSKGVGAPAGLAVVVTTRVGGVYFTSTNWGSSLTFSFGAGFENGCVDALGAVFECGTRVSFTLGTLFLCAFTSGKGGGGDYENDGNYFS